MSQRAAAQIVAVDRTVVAKVFNRYRASGLPWPIPNAVSDAALRQVIYPRIGAQAEQHHIDFDTVHLALQLKGATLAILHQEWVDEDPARNDLGYQQFCRRYKNYRRQLQISMRRTDQFGEVAYVDYSGMTAKYFDRHSMQDVECQVFIGVLGGSQYTYCEATHSQRLRDWLGSHVRMFAFLAASHAQSFLTTSNRQSPRRTDSSQRSTNRTKLFVNTMAPWHFQTGPEGPRISQGRSRGATCATLDTLRAPQATILFVGRTESRDRRLADEIK
jgi:transposase